jgi:hypothetical protein
VAGIPAAERERAAAQIGERLHRATTHGQNLRHPADIRVAHCDRSAGARTPSVGLNEGEIRVPRDVDTRRPIARLCQQGRDLRLVALEQNDFDRELCILDEVAPHPLPDRDDLGIVGDGANPQRKRL